jgi:ABC-type dipeptide/oligopeptide/nickel transport system permease component
MASAISPLPVPVSPWINTVAPVGATTLTKRTTRWRAAPLPMILSNLLLLNSLLSIAVFTEVVFSISTHALWLIAGASATQLVSPDIFLLS